MKKREITKIIKSAAVVSLSACLLVGCGNAGTENGLEKVVEETSAVEAAENDAAEEQSDTADSQTNEAASDETTDKESDEAAGGEDETASDTTTEASDTTADPGEVTYVTDFTSIDDYMGQFDMVTDPSIVIYNEQEHYAIKMQEGQHYQLKETDAVLCNVKKTDDESAYDITFRVDLEEGEYGCEVVFPNYHQVMLDYSKWTQEEEKFYFEIYDKEGNQLSGITCYLTPPDAYLASPEE